MSSFHQPFDGRRLSLSHIEIMRRHVETLTPVQDETTAIEHGLDGVHTTRRRRRPNILPTSLFGIALHPDHAEILQRRVEIKQPAGSGVLQRQTLPDTELQYSEINEEEIDGVYTVYLVYDLDEETMTVAWEPEDAKSNVRLYDISVKKHDPEPPETDPTFSATVKRIYRPGDVDIEAVWIELPPKEEGP